MTVAKRIVGLGAVAAAIAAMAGVGAGLISLAPWATAAEVKTINGRLDAIQVFMVADRVRVMCVDADMHPQDIQKRAECDYWTAYVRQQQAALLTNIMPGAGPGAGGR